MYIYICEESISRRAFQIDYTERRKQQGRQKRKKQGQKGNRLSSEIKYKKIQDVLFMFENEKGRGLSEKKTIQKITCVGGICVHKNFFLHNHGFI